MEASHRRPAPVTAVLVAAALAVMTVGTMMNPVGGVWLYDP